MEQRRGVVDKKKGALATIEFYEKKAGVFARLLGEPPRPAPPLLLVDVRLGSSRCSRSGGAGRASGDVLVDHLRAKAKRASDPQAAQFAALAQLVDRRQTQAEAGSHRAHCHQPLVR